LDIDRFRESPEEALKEIAGVAKKLFKQEHRHAVLTEDGEVMPCDLMTWAYWLEKGRSHRLLQQDDLPGGYWISTVFLGLNHQYGKGPPLWFETMIFEPSDGKPSSLTGKIHQRGPEIFCERYSTLAEALAGHESAKIAFLARQMKKAARDNVPDGMQAN
jgi:hypothetical protein